VRLLCLDHFFEQDVEAMRLDAGSHLCFDVGYERFLQLAREDFPEEVFTGLEAFFRDEHAAARARYAARAAAETERLYRRFRFDAVLAPSDTFFWVRAVIEHCRTLGIPFVVLQKEATIPPGWMDAPAREWGALSPFIADHMLVSSDHHKRFWVNAGTDASIIEVTGQPRFDVYRRPERRRPWSSLGVETGGRPAVLFLTYDVNAYLPVIDRTGLAPWQQLRDETEAVLLELAAAGEATVLIKSHPQPAEDQTAHLAALAASPGVQVLDPRGDVRQYLLNADVVVGFQTTALFESLAAGRPSVYTWWTEPTSSYAADLIPFHEAGDALAVARSPEDLRAAIQAGLRGDGLGDPAAAERLVTEYMGPVDGSAARRSWESLERVVAGAPRTPARARLDSVARRLRPATAAGAGALAAALGTAERALPVSYVAYKALSRLPGRPEPIGVDVFRAELGRHRGRAVQRLRAAMKK
jgi:hypothetical protein